MNILRNRSNVITYSVNKAINQELYISVQNGEVVINAPWYMGNSQIQKVVEEKKQWILNKIQEYEKAIENKKEYSKLEIVKVLGKKYVLNIQYSNIKMPSLRIEKSEIIVELPNQYKKIENSEIIEMLMRKMYEKIAEKEIEKVMEKTRIMTGIAPEDYKIEKMNKALAKCENNRIFINPEIAMYKEEVIEYIVLHEFCHLRYKNHTKSFYNMLETYMENYEEYAKEVSRLQY